MNDLKCMCGVGMSGYCAVHKHGWAYQLPQQASQPDPKDQRIAELAQSASDSCDQIIRLSDERDRLQKRVESAEAALADASQRGDRWKEAAKKLRGERDAYRRAKEENDERYMIERDEARQERDAARAEVALWKSGEAHALALAHRLEEELTAARAECQELRSRLPLSGGNYRTRLELREANQRLEAGAARMREALERIRDGGVLPGRLAGVQERMLEMCALAREALASTTAGTLAFGVIEAARKAAHEARMAKQPHIAELLERNLQAYDQATPHLINTDISCDSNCQCMLIGSQTEPDMNLDCPVHGKRKDGGETPGGTDGQG